MKIEVRPMTADDWTDVRSIYLMGIATGNATFQTEAPAWNDWDNGHLRFGRLVAVSGYITVGWAALSPVSSRCVYAGVAEVSIYIHPDYSGRGIGSELLRMLVRDSENNNIWTLQAGIFPENSGSLRIHEKAGFRQVGYRERIGKMNGKWRNTILLERRSSTI